MSDPKVPAVEVPDTSNWGWQCEDCGYFTIGVKAAEDHSDRFKHSLAMAPPPGER